MDIYEIRLTNLRWIIDRHYPNRRARLARELGRRNNEIWRVFATDPKHKRNVGADFAREIECHLGYPRGWLDQRHVFDDTPLTSDLPKRRAPTADRLLPPPVVVLHPDGHLCVPILDYRDASAWAKSEAPYERTTARETMWIPGSDFSRMTIGLRVEGESMRELFYSGDIVIIDREIQPSNGDYVGAYLRKAKQFVFARFESDDPGKAQRFTLLPENAAYPPIEINRLNSAILLGTMVMHLRLRRRPKNPKG